MSWNIAIITVSDKGYIGEREDVSAGVIRQLIEEYKIGHVTDYRIIPDEIEQITDTMRQLIDENIHLIITTGGTGLAKRDVTPEATKQVMDKEIPGLSEMMRYQAMLSQPRAALSRGMVVTAQQTLIINLPGSPKGAKENLQSIIEVLPHALAILTGHETEH